MIKVKEPSAFPVAAPTPIRNLSATIIQSQWRGYVIRKNFKLVGLFSWGPSRAALPRQTYEIEEQERQFDAPLPRPDTPPRPPPPPRPDWNDASASSVLSYALADQQKLRNRAKKQKNRLADEYTRLGLQFESALIQHKLALQYYEFRSYYFVFLPVTLIATSITIIGFLISGNTQDDNGANDDGAAEDPASEFEPLLTGQSKQILSLVVGILGAITTLFNTIGKRTNYQSQSDMHRSAVKALEKICLTVEFEREWFDRNVLDHDIENAGSDDNKKLAESFGADLKTHQASFKAMLDACCDSPVPYEVAQAFTLLEQIFCLNVYEKGSSDIRPLMYHYHKLWKEYSTYRLWPLKAPSIKVSRKVKDWKRERAKYGDDDDDDEESQWGCVRICFCCGKYRQIRS